MAPSKAVVLLLFVSLIFPNLGSNASADTIDVGHLVKAASGQVDSVAIIVTRHPDGQSWTSNSERAKRRFSPASTSKVPHTLIALEQGLATRESVYTWDGVPRSVRAWNQNQTLETAFQRSVVWVFQEIVQTAGRDMMSRALTEFSYGNMDVGTTAELTTYWLNDTLQISADEQVAFLSKIAQEQLPLSASTYAAAKAIMVSAADGNWVMRSKTGWRYNEGDTDIGWFVGWLECTKETYVFALNMDMPDSRFLSMRTSIMYSVLEGIDAFDCD